MVRDRASLWKQIITAVGETEVRMFSIFTEYPQPLTLTFGIRHTLSCVLVDCTFFFLNHTQLLMYLCIPEVPTRECSVFGRYSNTVVGRVKAVEYVNFWHHGKFFG